MSEIFDPPGRPDRPPRRRRRRWGIVALAIAFLVVVAAGAGAVGYYDWCRDTGGPHGVVTVKIPEGATGDQVAAILNEQGVTRCGGVVGRSLLQETGQAESIRAGTYELTTNMTLDRVLAVITSVPEPVATASITIPEGYRLTQIADVVRSDLGIPAREFLQLADSGAPSLPPYLPKSSSTAEGFLFPNTYEFAKSGTEPGEVVDLMLQNFGDEVSGLPWGNAKKLGMTPYEIVVMASLIEREARIPDERPKIAAVIYNRLKAGEILGIDATLEYIDPDPSDGLTASDLRIDSPYNSRLHKGLPPTPIASPGLASLQAALEPANVAYRYYVLCGQDGSHVFSSSYSQFLRDKASCLG